MSFFELFQPGLRFLREEKDRQKMLVAEPKYGKGGGPLGIDLDGGTATFTMPPTSAHAGSGLDSDDAADVNPAEVTPAEVADVAPAAVAEVTPAESADVAPAESADVAPAESANVAPAEGVNVAPAEGADVAPTEGANVRDHDGKGRRRAKD